MVAERLSRGLKREKAEPLASAASSESAQLRIDSDAAKKRRNLSFHLGVTRFATESLYLVAGHSSKRRTCSWCGTTQTPVWRWYGEAKTHLMCNACALRKRRKRRQDPKQHKKPDLSSAKEDALAGAVGRDNLQAIPDTALCSDTVDIAAPILHQSTDTDQHETGIGHSSMEADTTTLSTEERTALRRRLRRFMSAEKRRLLSGADMSGTPLLPRPVLPTSQSQSDLFGLAPWPRVVLVPTLVYLEAPEFYSWEGAGHYDEHTEHCVQHSAYGNYRINSMSQPRI